jgi:hypothetical protein
MPFEDAAGLAEAWEPERLAGGMAAEERFAAPPTDCAP